MGEFFIYSFFFGMLGFLFPVFVYLDGYADTSENKLWFSLSVYKFFKVFGGYAQIKKEGLVFHITDKKAIILPYAEMTDTRKKFELTQGFQLYRYHQTVETGIVEKPYSVLVAAALQSLGGQIFSVLQTKHPFLSLKNNTLLSEEKGVKLTVHAVTVFNGLVLSIAVGKKILEVIINWIRTRKSTVFWKKRRNS